MSHLRILNGLDGSNLIAPTAVSGNEVTIMVKVINQGDVPIGPPVYVAVYKESSPKTDLPVDTIAVGTGSTLAQLLPGDTAEVVIHILDITRFLPFANMV